MKTRYQTRQAICRKIDSERERARELIYQSEINYAEFDRIRKLNPTRTSDIEAMNWAKKQSRKLLRMAERIEKNKIPHLSEKLGEFDTMLLPGCGDDRSVPVK